MRAFACPVCNEYVPFDADTCGNCSTPVGMYLASKAMVALDGEAALDRGTAVARCSEHAATGCNWVVEVDAEPVDMPDDRRGRCLADSLIRRVPAPGHPHAKELASTAQVLRRLVFQLFDLNLPIEPFWMYDGGLGFDLLSSETSDDPVVIGHADGIITIDLAESMDDYRVAQRVKLGEPYRTMLGHFRHESGHYYEHRLVETPPGEERYLGDCRALFGDERADYQAALTRHYEEGAPPGWQSQYISEYATMHPWEDFAECFAHYLHITDTIDTCREAGMVLHADRARFNEPHDVTPLENYDDVPVAKLLFDWKWMSLFFNRVNASMGKGAFYPFELPPPVVGKLGFVHRVVRDTAREHSAGVSDARA
ncbi:MAG: putative zinc-binding metallopeptidase [Gordonia sp. (in: high G+C Gram-positive bacteria)]|uniref:zinc-binding metallopeptidase family protein n=1 Tax=Gordonia sp. (in: high G+C Gram-positive bacteria) TaxID=84139 RepID=UPI0039E22F73